MDYTFLINSPHEFSPKPDLDIPAPEALREHLLYRDALAIRGAPVIYKNGPVYALIGDAENEYILDDIADVKGEARGYKPVGWTVPFDHPRAYNIFRTDHLEHESLCALISGDRTELTARLGGLAFVRGQANLAQKSIMAIPDCIVPLSENAAVQMWSPVGNVQTERLLRKVIELGGEPVMTSCNLSGEPEITTDEDMLGFYAGTSLYVAGQPITQPSFPRELRSSYPILEITKSGVVPIRTGCFSLEIVMRLVEGLPIGDYQPKTLPESKYPDHVLQVSDLPLHAQHLSGADLRPFVLDAMGVSTSATDFDTFR